MAREARIAQPIYLDYNATTPIAPEVRSALRPYMEEYFGNPSSAHRFGQLARAGVETARAQVAGLLGAKSTEIIFTGSGTESDNLAIFGIIRGSRKTAGHMITSSVEHPAVDVVCHQLAAEGWSITRLPVDGNGRVDPDDVRRAVRSDTVLVSIMHANNEVGSIQPLQAISVILRERDIPFHTDAAQSAGKIPCRVDELGVDLLTIAGHKLYAPKGVGALYVRAGVSLAPFMRGAGQEGGRRPGTENVSGIVGLGAACELAAAEGEQRTAHLGRTRDLLGALLNAGLDDIRRNGDQDWVLPNTLSVGFGGILVADLVDALDGVAASAGSACHGKGGGLSATLKAMAVPERYALGTLRLSTGRPTTEEDIRTAADRIITAVKKLRR